MAVNYSPAIVKDGLVLHLDAANYKSYSGSGTVWSDRSGFGNDGTLINSPTFSKNNYGELNFNGQVNSSASYIDIPSKIENFFTNTISIAAWVYPKNFVGYGTDGKCIVSKNVSSLTSPYTIYDLATNQNGQVWFAVGDGINRYGFLSNTVLSLNKWYFLVGTYNGSTLNIYINGIKDSAIGTATYTLGKNNLSTSIGANPRLSPYYDTFLGPISSVLMYNKAISQLEILQNFNATRRRFGL